MRCSFEIILALSAHMFTADSFMCIFYSTSSMLPYGTSCFLCTGAELSAGCDSGFLSGLPPPVPALNVSWHTYCGFLYSHLPTIHSCMDMHAVEAAGTLSSFQGSSFCPSSYSTPSATPRDSKSCLREPDRRRSWGRVDESVENTSWLVNLPQ